MVEGWETGARHGRGENRAREQLRLGVGADDDCLPRGHGGGGWAAASPHLEPHAVNEHSYRTSTRVVT